MIEKVKADAAREADRGLARELHQRLGWRKAQTTGVTMLMLNDRKT